MFKQTQKSEYWKRIELLYARVLAEEGATNPMIADAVSGLKAEFDRIFPDEDVLPPWSIPLDPRVEDEAWLRERELLNRVMACFAIVLPFKVAQVLKYYSVENMRVAGHA